MTLIIWLRDTFHADAKLFKEIFIIWSNCGLFEMSRGKLNCFLSEKREYRPVSSMKNWFVQFMSICALSSSSIGDGGCGQRQSFLHRVSEKFSFQSFDIKPIIRFIQSIFVGLYEYNSKKMPWKVFISIWLSYLFNSCGCSIL